MNTKWCTFNENTKVLSVIEGEYAGTQWMFTKLDVLGVDEDKNDVRVDLEIRILQSPKKFAKEFDEQKPERFSDFMEVVVRPYVSLWIQKVSAEAIEKVKNGVPIE